MLCLKYLKSVEEAIALNSLLYIKLKERFWEGTELDLTMTNRSKLNR